MSRRHNTKHRRGRSNYKNRLADRGLTRTPVMKWTGMSYTQIQTAFDRLDHYRWKTVPVTGPYGHEYIQRRELIR